MSKELNKAPVEQAGGDERAAFEKIHTVPRGIMWNEEKSQYVRAHEKHCSLRTWNSFVALWAGWMDRAALAQPSLMPPDRGPWHAVKWDGGRRVDLSSDDFEHDVALTVSGDFVEGDKFRYAQELAAWMNAHLAQPSPVQAEQHWPKLEKPAQVGGVRFSAGVSSRLVVEAAQRLYEFESTPEKEAERIERLQAFREQCFEPLGTEFSKVLSDNLPELLSTAQAEQAEAERPEVEEVSEFEREDIARSAFETAMADGISLDSFLSLSNTLAARYERIVGALRAVIAQLRQHKNDYMDSGQETYRALQNEIREREAEIARLDGLVSGRTAERDAALARVAELEKQEPVATIAKVPGEDWNGLHFYRDLQGMQLGTKLYAAPVAQAQHSVPDGWRIERSAERIVVMNLNNGAGYAAARDGESGIAESVLYLLAADLLAAAPGKEGL
ncbi:hypothetical protein ACQUHS_15015 [Pseudomonas aeruginosa]|uniref:hypothetical protein n=1 Tax=Pseudomonas aeruginosa TaxID=287 RepID=UPI00208FDD23